MAIDSQEIERRFPEWSSQKDERSGFYTYTRVSFGGCIRQHGLTGTAAVFKVSAEQVILFPYSKNDALYIEYGEQGTDGVQEFERVALFVDTLPEEE